jgi:MFS family permease
VSRRDLFRSRSVVALLAAEIVSTTGSQMTWLALPWFVLVTTGSAARMSFVVGAELIGLAALGFPGGRLLGRIGARRTMMLCDAARAPLMLIIPLLHWTVGLSFAVLLLVAFALGAFAAPYFAAQKVIVPELLGEDEQRVSEAQALFQAATRMTLLLGPALAGVLIGVIGATSVLVVDACSYLVSLLLVFAFVPQRPPVKQEPEDRSVKRGIRFILSDPLLRVWAPIFAVGDAAWNAFFIAVPVLVLARFGHEPQIAGWLFAAFGVGAVLGNVITFRFLMGRYDGLVIISVCIMGQALPLWLLWLPVPAAVLAAALCVSGIANGLVNPSLHALSMLRVPPALRPNVMTTQMVFWALVNPLGVFLAGPMLDAFGTTPVLIGFAAVQTLMMAAAGLAAAREHGRKQAEPALAPVP